METFIMKNLLTTSLFWHDKGIATIPVGYKAKRPDFTALKRVGSVDEKGIVRDKSGIRIGEIEDDGTVLDKSGIKIGTAKGVDKKRTAVMFFFQ